MLDIKDFRPVLSHGFYQAQVKCPECDGWIMTKNLEVHKTMDGENDLLHAECKDVICTARPAGGETCGHELGDISLVGWHHRAPVKWGDPKVR